MPEQNQLPRIPVSVVVPVYSGELYLQSLATALDALRRDWEEAGSPMFLVEAVFVADAPRDGSVALLEQLAAQHGWLRVITLSRNFGQHPATIAGILHTSGDWVVTMDEDLQHHPKFLPRLLRAAVERSDDVVYARPQQSAHGGGYRDLGSRALKRVMAWLAGDPVIVHFSSFRLIRGPVARAAASVCSHETYLDVALTWFTNRFQPMALPLSDQRYRQTGRSGYSLGKLLSHARRLVVSSQTKALRAGAMLGLIAMLAAVVVGTGVILQKLIDPEFVQVRGWTSLFAVILFFGGISSFLLGVSLEYVRTLVLHAQGKPTFFEIDRSQDRHLRDYFRQETGEAAGLPTVP
jgi:glycosyltransferase involved in cell wall biosynthesis